MKYMIMMNSPRDGYAQFMSWPKEILEAHFSFMEAFGQKLRKSGELVDAEGLASPTQAKAVRAGKDGKPVNMVGAVITVDCPSMVASSASDPSGAASQQPPVGRRPPEL